MSRFIFTLTLPDATGASRTLWAFIAALRRQDHEVTVVHGPIPKNERSILPELHELGVETLLEPGLAFPASPFLVGRLARLFQARTPRAIIGVQQRDRAVALQAARRLGVPGVATAQNTHIFWGRWPLNRLKERYYGWALRNLAHLVTCSSPVVQNEVVHRYGVPREKTAYLPCAVDLKQIVRLSDDARNQLRSELGVQPNEFMMTNVGRINLQKGHDLLLRAFAGLNPAQRGIKLVIVGDVSQDAQRANMERYRAQLLHYVEQQGLEKQVVFTGWRSDVPSILAAGDGYVHAARWEGFGIAPFEGMSAIRPTIWTDCWGRPAGFHDDVHGWLVPTENVPALQAAMEKLLALTSEQRHAMGQASRLFVEQNYDAQRVGDRFVEILEASLATWDDQHGSKLRSQNDGHTS